jgi:hypothetical protein
MRLENSRITVMSDGRASIDRSKPLSPDYRPFTGYKTWL